MRHWTLACLLSLALLSACSHSDEDAQSANGSGGGTAAGMGPGGMGPGGMGAGGGGGAGQATPGSEEDLVQSAGDRILFDTDRNSLNPQAVATLDKQSAWLRQYPQVNIWVAGNCD